MKIPSIINLIFALVIITGSFKPGFSQLSGSYSIGGSSADFNSINEAVEKLTKEGISSTVIFNIRPGLYEEQIILDSIPGNSCERTITFQSENEDNTSVIITNTNTQDSNYVFQLKNVKGVIVKNITIKSIKNSIYNTVLAITGANCCSFIGNILQCPSTSNYNFSEVVVKFNRGSIGNFNLFFIKNKIENGSFGMVTPYPAGASCTIKNNDFINQFKSAIDLDGSNTIENNYFISKPGSSNYEGIYLGGGSNFSIRNNIIIVKSGGRGISIAGFYPGSTNNLIANNFVSIGGSSGACLGITSQNNGFVKVLNNNVNVYGTAPNNDPFAINNSALVLDEGTVLNNILLNTGGGYAVVHVGMSQCNFNNLFVTGPYLAVRPVHPDVGNNEYYIDLNDWQSKTGFDKNSLSINPGYTSRDDLHISNIALNGSGTPIPEVQTDIDGEIRDSLKPDIGADEIFPIISKTLSITLPNEGSEFCPNDTLPISWISTGVDLVNILLFNIIDTSFQIIGENVEASVGKLNWPIPSEFSGKAENQIGIYDASDHSIADSSSKFEINRIYKTEEVFKICVGDKFEFPDGHVEENIQDEITHISNFKTTLACDSIIVTTVKPLSIDTSITAQDPILISNEIGDSTHYQWINCNDSSMISNATQKSFQAIKNGEYAVIIKKNGCIDTSACYSIFTVDVLVLGWNNSVEAFPNPFNETINISLKNLTENLLIQVVSLQGKIVFSKQYFNQKEVNLTLPEQTSGIYFMHLISDRGMAIIKIRKN